MTYRDNQWLADFGRRLASTMLWMLLLAGLCRAQQPGSIILLDVSGSMEKDHGIQYQRYSRGYAAGRSQMQQLVQMLGTILDSSCHCPASLGQFSSSHEPAPVTGPMRGAQLVAHVPPTAGGQDTELSFALAMGMKQGNDRFIFIITDNQNDFAGSLSDAEFYNSLAHDPAINSVYFVPLADASAAQDALVLYGVGTGRAPRDVLRTVISEFAVAVKSEAVQFRPLYEQEQGHPQLAFSHNISQINGEGDEQPAVLEGDSVVLPFEEGHSLDGRIKFKLHSNLKHWAIVDGRLTRAQVKVEVPSEFISAGEVSLPVSLSGPKKLNVPPAGDSLEIYELPLNGLEDSGVILRRSGLFSTTLPDIRVQVHLNATIGLAQRPDDAGMRPVFSPELQQRMRAVRNLPEIMNAMTFQGGGSSNTSMERNIPVTRELVLRVHPNSSKNALAMAIKYGLPLPVLAAALGGLLLLRPSNFTLIDPAGRARVLAFTPFRRAVPLFWGGKAVATLKKTGPGFQIQPERGYKGEPMQFHSAPARFEIINNTSGDRGQFQLSPGSERKKSTSQGGRL
jgi:hypothetical protein